jgi:hypothetical protein
MCTEFFLLEIIRNISPDFDFLLMVKKNIWYLLLHFFSNSVCETWWWHILGYIGMYTWNAYQILTTADIVTNSIPPIDSLSTVSEAIKMVA